MKKYNCSVGDKRGAFGECMELAKNKKGDWVRASDAEKAISNLEKEIAKLKEKGARR